MKCQCRFCHAPLSVSFANLGMSPLSNSYIKPEHASNMERFYPLHAFVCERCFLVQLEEFESPQAIFSDYAYFSSYSDSWLQHCEKFAAETIERFSLGAKSSVVEVASNDGYLLQYFKRAGIPVLGVEPAENVAKVAAEKGIKSRVAFFGAELATTLRSEGMSADLLIGNNVLAHVPDINSFVKGLKILLSPQGVVSLEFPHLLRLIENNQFDTIYHEHFSYLSVGTVQEILNHHGLSLFDVEELSTHGGSVRLFAAHKEDSSKQPSVRVAKVLDEEKKAGLRTLAPYLAFSQKVQNIKRELLTFLIKTKQEGKRIVGYGAAAKGNTLLNYCGVREDFLDYVVDRSPHKQGLYLPGTHIPIKSPEEIARTKPDFVLILPWNIRTEVAQQMQHVRGWGGKFVVPIPELEIF